MNQKQRILALLKSAPTTNVQLNEVCYRYGARIHELRAEGHNITSEQTVKGLWTFTLSGT